METNSSFQMSTHGPAGGGGGGGYKALECMYHLGETLTFPLSSDKAFTEIHSTM